MYRRQINKYAFFTLQNKIWFILFRVSLIYIKNLLYLILFLSLIRTTMHTYI